MAKVEPAAEEDDEPEPGKAAEEQLVPAGELTAEVAAELREDLEVEVG